MSRDTYVTLNPVQLLFVLLCHSARSQMLRPIPCCVFGVLHCVVLMSFKSGTFLFSLSGILAGSGVSDVLESESEVNERLEDEQSIQIIFFQCNFKRKWTVISNSFLFTPFFLQNKKSHNLLKHHTIYENKLGFTEFGVTKCNAVKDDFDNLFKSLV